MSGLPEILREQSVISKEALGNSQTDPVREPLGTVLRRIRVSDWTNLKVRGHESSSQPGKGLSQRLGTVSLDAFTVREDDVLRLPRKHLLQR